ncbi:hypothetical protein ACFYYH_02315 [Streptomyces sp. NPDC002018]|uniref:hypothetical protein n=1 Tax=Streptomyces sp. NPDC002018 TaxID=3364629 RepID=UPI00369B5601
MFRTTTPAQSSVQSPARRSVRRTTLAVAGCAAALGLALSTVVPAVAAPASGVSAPASASAPTSASAATAVDSKGRYTAVEIRTFLRTFYDRRGPGAFARKYGISPQLAKKVAESKGFDPLLCAQNTPQSIGIGPVSTAQSARVGWATVTTRWTSGKSASFIAYVDLDAKRPILLLDVDCPTNR